ncbi:MAG TPA: hypothetical protein VHM23_29025 [Actinomycetota bacterium]|nr:hypothetical protein [Actinomycetota bacterium]
MITSYQFADPQTSVINDVAVTKRGAWFTDSLQAQLYFVPVGRAGIPKPFRTLALSGPAADTSGEFNLNGIQAARGGKTLIVAHSTNGELYRVDPTSGASARIAGISVPQVDGLVLKGRRLWAVQNTNQVTRIRLDRELSSGVAGRSSPATGSRPQHRGPVRPPAGGGQCQVRHRLPARRRPVRGGPGQGLTPGSSSGLIRTPNVAPDG